MALYPIHAQIAAVEAAAKADPTTRPSSQAALTLRAVSAACWTVNPWEVEPSWPVDDRLTRAMEGLMP